MLKMVDRFAIDAELGRGGMAVVYAARDTATNERVAVKVLNQASDDDTLKRFAREVKAASALSHPGICKVFAYGEHEGAPYMAMEIIEGPTLSRLSKRAGPVPAMVCAALLRQLLEALACAHAAGVIHRDLKPQNLMITKSGQLKLLDFGIAKAVDDETLTKTGLLVGTPAFMSPEQARAEPLDARTDLFSAGVTLRALASGRPTRFATRMDPAAALGRVVNEPLGPLFETTPHIPVALEAVLGALTALDREQRVASALAALEMLNASSLLSTDAAALLASYIASPESVGEKLRAEQARAELALAEQLGTRRGGETAAVFALARAAALMPGDEACRQKLAAACVAQRISIEPKEDAQLTELLAAFEAEPRKAGVLRSIAERARAIGDVRRAAAFLWRYLAEKPNDTLVRQQLGVMLEGPGEAPHLARLTTTRIMAGIKTGGLKAGPAHVGVPTRAMNRDGATQTRGTTQATVIVAGADDGSGSAWITKAIVAAVLILATGGGVYMLSAGFSMTKKAVTTDVDAVEAQAEKHVQVNVLSQHLARAESALASDQLGTAIMKATLIISSNPDIETGRAALRVRAKAYAKQGNRDKALADCERYLQTATRLDDPHIAEMKQLMTTVTDN